MDEPQKKPDSASKKSAYIIAGVVVLALVALGIYAYNHQGSGQNSDQQLTRQDDSAITAPPDASATPTTVPPAGTGKKLAYGDAIKAYPERFQFVQCLGAPATIAVKKGSPVMLDNRDAVVHTFKADTQTFRIAGYDYAVFYPQVLGNLAVTCDGKNRVMLNVEK